MLEEKYSHILIFRRTHCCPLWAGVNYSRASRFRKHSMYNFKGLNMKFPHPRELMPSTPITSQCSSSAEENSLHLIKLLSCLSFPNEIGSRQVHKDSHRALGHFPGQQGHHPEVTHSPFPDLTHGHICLQHKHIWALICDFLRSDVFEACFGSPCASFPDCWALNGR